MWETRRPHAMRVPILFRVGPGLGAAVTVFAAPEFSGAACLPGVRLPSMLMYTCCWIDGPRYVDAFFTRTFYLLVGLRSDPRDAEHKPPVPALPSAHAMQAVLPSLCVCRSSQAVQSPLVPS